MKKKYYEVVFEGKPDEISGMFEGFLIGRKAVWEWYHNKESGIESESLLKVIKEWISHKKRVTHFVLEKDFHNELEKAVSGKNDPLYNKLKFAGQSKAIKNCSFKFTANAYAKKFGDEIKDVISSCPADIIIENFSPVEEIDDSAKGVELYASTHDYTYKATGEAKGDFGSIIQFRKKLEDHPLIQVSTIKLNF